jgi:hypothetical protein
VADLGCIFAAVLTIACYLLGTSSEGDKVLNILIGRYAINSLAVQLELPETATSPLALHFLQCRTQEIQNWLRAHNGAMAGGGGGRGVEDFVVDATYGGHVRRMQLSFVLGCDWLIGVAAVISQFIHIVIVLPCAPNVMMFLIGLPPHIFVSS